MSEIISITRFTFHEGRVEDFKQLFAACVQIARCDTGTRQYEAYLNDDQSTAVVLERYENVSAVRGHITNIGPELLGQIMATATIHQEALGPADKEVRLLAQQSSAQMFTSLKLGTVRDSFGERD